VTDLPKSWLFQQLGAFSQTHYSKEYQMVGLLILKYGILNNEYGFMLDFIVIAEEVIS